VTGAVVGAGSVKGCRVSTVSIAIHRNAQTILCSYTRVVLCEPCMIAVWSRKDQCFDALSGDAVEASRCPS